MKRRHGSRQRTRNQAKRLTYCQNFKRLTRRQSQEIYEDYRTFLYNYLIMHLPKVEIDILVSSTYTVCFGAPFTELQEQSGCYYHEIINDLKKIARFLNPHDFAAFFLDEAPEVYRKLSEEDFEYAKSACHIWSLAEGFPMDVMRTYWYEYATCVDTDVVDAAWEDPRFGIYLDEYAATHAEELRNNPWDSPENVGYLWPWRQKWAWYRQKQKGTVIHEENSVPPVNNVPMFRISKRDANVPAFVDSDILLLTENLVDFQDRWFSLIQNEEDQAVAEDFAEWKSSTASQIQNGTARIYASKEFTAEDVWVSAIGWFGNHRRFHVNRWKILVKWVAFQTPSGETNYCRMFSHEAQGICRINLFPRILKAVTYCSTNRILECHAPYRPHYSMKVSMSKWPKPSFEDFSANRIASICYMVDFTFDDEAELKHDVEEFQVTEDIFQILLREI